MPMTAGIADADTSTTQAGISGTLLVPVILTLIPFLVAGQAWVWWTFRHRVTGPSYL
jgi:cytochrome bd-type quinol oxidase subunit 2